MTVIFDQSLKSWLLEEFVKLGATGYTVMPCSGAGRRQLAAAEVIETNNNIRIEVIVTAEVCDSLIDFLRRKINESHHLTACVETIDVVRVGRFTPVNELVASTH